MENQFVPYRLSRKLKEKGFDEPCLTNYSIDEDLQPINKDFFIQNSMFARKKFSKKVCTAPLWQQAVDWFSTKHNLDIETCINWRWKDENQEKSIKIYSFTISQVIGTTLSFDGGKELNQYKTRIEAIEKAIEYALTLI